MRHVFPDSHPLGLITNPNPSTEGKAAVRWINSLVAAGHAVYVPEVIDYELRRELLRAGKSESVSLLNSLKLTLHYEPITTDALLLAAELWARMRNSGTPTGDPKKLDIDVILAAQARTAGARFGVPDADLVVATSNVGHLSRLVGADLWTNVRPCEDYARIFLTTLPWTSVRRKSRPA